MRERQRRARPGSRLRDDDAHAAEIRDRVGNLLRRDEQRLELEQPARDAARERLAVERRDELVEAHALRTAACEDDRSHVVDPQAR